MKTVNRVMMAANYGFAVLNAVLVCAVLVRTGTVLWVVAGLGVMNLIVGTLLAVRPLKRFYELDW